MLKSFDVLKREAEEKVNSRRKAYFDDLNNALANLLAESEHISGNFIIYGNTLKFRHHPLVEEAIGQLKKDPNWEIGTSKFDPGWLYFIKVKENDGG